MAEDLRERKKWRRIKNGPERQKSGQGGKQQAVGEAWIAIFWLTPGFKNWTLICQFCVLNRGTLIYCGIHRYYVRHIVCNNCEGVVLRQCLPFGQYNVREYKVCSDKNLSSTMCIHRSGDLKALALLVPHETAAISARSVYTIQPTLRASLSGTFLQTLPDLVTPLKGHSLSPCSCPATRSAPSERSFRY